MYSEEMIQNYIKWAGFINEQYGIFTFITHFSLVALSIIFIERAFSNPGKRTTIALSILL